MGGVIQSFCAGESVFAFDATKRIRETNTSRQVCLSSGDAGSLWIPLIPWTFQVCEVYFASPVVPHRIQGCTLCDIQQTFFHPAPPPPNYSFPLTFILCPSVSQVFASWGRQRRCDTGGVDGTGTCGARR